MPIVKTFGFTLNTDADTFCTWFEDRNRLWKLDGTSGATGGLVDIQEAKREQLRSRPKFCFDAVVEITKGDNEWAKAEKLFFSDFRLRRGIYRTGVIVIMVIPAARAGKVVIRALCRDKDALDGFSLLLNKIAEAYPEVEAKIREQEDKRVVSGSPDSDQPYVLTGTRKRGRPRVAGYDEAYQNVLDGMDMETAFDKYMSTVQNPIADDWSNFRRAMNRRKKKGET